jgi:hypothetical protein
MNPTAPRPLPSWKAACKSEAMDPGEVEMVADRYVAYRDFMAGKPGALEIADWFRFYRMEKESEIGSDGVVSGCSATGDAIEQACLARPREFLAVLKLRLGE